MFGALVLNCTNSKCVSASASALALDTRVHRLIRLRTFATHGRGSLAASSSPSLSLCLFHELAIFSTDAPPYNSILFITLPKTYQKGGKPPRKQKHQTHTLAQKNGFAVTRCQMHQTHTLAQKNGFAVTRCQMSEYDMHSSNETTLVQIRA